MWFQSRTSLNEPFFASVLSVCLSVHFGASTTTKRIHLFVSTFPSSFDHDLQMLPLALCKSLKFTAGKTTSIHHRNDEFSMSHQMECNPIVDSHRNSMFAFRQWCIIRADSFSPNDKLCGWLSITNYYINGITTIWIQGNTWLLWMSWSAIKALLLWQQRPRRYTKNILSMFQPNLWRLCVGKLERIIQSKSLWWMQWFWWKCRNADLECLWCGNRQGMVLTPTFCFGIVTWTISKCSLDIKYKTGFIWLGHVYISLA